MQILKDALCRMRITDQSQLAVSVRSREKYELPLVLLAKLFSQFFCLNMANLSQMWLVCLLVVRTYFKMFSSHCNLLFCIAWSPACTWWRSHVVNILSSVVTIEKLTQWLPFAGYTVLFFHILWPCCAAYRPEFRSNIR